jgi:hypothetical protein
MPRTFNDSIGIIFAALNNMIDFSAGEEDPSERDPKTHGG